eukprot:1359944-Pleurochrysis_carterae.AAC.1
MCVSARLCATVRTRAAFARVSMAVKHTAVQGRQARGDGLLCDLRVFRYEIASQHAETTYAVCCRLLRKPSRGEREGGDKVLW